MRGWGPWMYLGGHFLACLPRNLYLNRDLSCFPLVVAVFLVFTFTLGLFLFVSFLRCGSVFFHAISRDFGLCFFPVVFLLPSLLLCPNWPPRRGFEGILSCGFCVKCGYRIFFFFFFSFVFCFSGFFFLVVSCAGRAGGEFFVLVVGVGYLVPSEQLFLKWFECWERISFPFLGFCCKDGLMTNRFF